MLCVGSGLKKKNSKNHNFKPQTIFCVPGSFPRIKDSFCEALDKRNNPSSVCLWRKCGVFHLGGLGFYEKPDQENASWNFWPGLVAGSVIHHWTSSSLSPGPGAYPLALTHLSRTFSSYRGTWLPLCVFYTCTHTSLVFI